MVEAAPTDDFSHFWLDKVLNGMGMKRKGKIKKEYKELDSFERSHRKKLRTKKKRIGTSQGRKKTYY
jgi:hypothetical protein